MIVKCIYNNYDKLQLPPGLKEYLSDIYQGQLDKKLPLKIGKLYLCYAISFGPFGEWFFILDETGVTYPNYYQNGLFAPSDKYVSRYWTVGSFVDFKNNESPLLAFKAWAENEFFHGQLFEGNTHAMSVFDYYRRLMDVEFIRPDIVNKAQKLDSPFWVLDDETGEAWEVNPFDAIIKVPGTDKMLINPYFQGNREPETAATN